MSKQTLKLALEALDAALSDDQPYIEKSKQAITALREALAEQPAQQEPVAYFNPQVKGGFYWAKPTKITAPVTVSVEPMPLYTTPPAPAREWVGLTDEEFEDIELECRSTPFGKIEAMQKVEAKLKGKNT